MRVQLPSGVILDTPHKEVYEGYLKFGAVEVKEVEQKPTSDTVKSRKTKITNVEE